MSQGTKVFYYCVEYKWDMELIEKTKKAREALRKFE
jgi:hypothetical protein